MGIPDLTLPLVYYSRLRGLSYAAQYIFLRSATKLFAKTKSQKPPTFAEVKLLQNETEKLIQDDIRNMAEGFYPRAVLAPENHLKSLALFPQVVYDGLKVEWRRARGKTVDFSEDAKAYLGDLPRYFRRNFHFQTDGYLSEQSARLYDYQVEMLFNGAADAMRRLIIPPMKRKFNFSDGEGLTFLEIGAGTGSATRSMKLAFPKAKIVVLDLSDPYLKHAQKRLSNFKRLDFVQADAAHLPFSNGTFDAVYSVFLFHELPRDVRSEVLIEAKRVLKSKAIFAFVDSLQKSDFKEVDHILEQFPADFHEPFYRDYLATPMEALMKEAGFGGIEGSRGYLSKWCLGSAE